MGWAARWHEVTFPVAWCYHPSCYCTAPYASHTICPFWGTWWSLTVWGSQLAPCTGHFHPAPAPRECVHHLLGFCWFWCKQGSWPDLVSWQIASWQINSVPSHWDFIFASHIWRVSQAACCRQSLSGRKDRAPLHNHFAVQYVWRPQPPQADLPKKPPSGEKPL